MLKRLPAIQRPGFNPWVEPKALDKTNQDKPSVFSVLSTTPRETVLLFVPIM